MLSDCHKYVQEKLNISNILHDTLQPVKFCCTLPVTKFINKDRKHNRICSYQGSWADRFTGPLRIRGEALCPGRGGAFGGRGGAFGGRGKAYGRGGGASCRRLTKHYPGNPRIHQI